MKINIIMKDCVVKDNYKTHAGFALKNTNFSDHLCTILNNKKHDLREKRLEFGISSFVEISQNIAFLYSFCIFISILCFIYTKKFDFIISLIHIIPAFCIIVIIGVLVGKYRIYLYYFIYGLCIFTGLIYIAHIILYGSEFNTESAIAFLSTNSDESIEFIDSFLSIELLSIYVLYIIMSYMFLRKIVKKSNNYSLNYKTKIYSILILSLIYMPFASLRYFRTPFDPYFPTTIIKKIIAAKKEIQLASMLQAGYNNFAEATYPGAQTIILVIGESAGRRNMHLYGYPRNTTPDMERIDGLHIFTDVISSAPTTQKSISRMLTLADLNNNPYTTTVFDMFKAAGFKTFWISAQFSSHTPGSGIIPILAQRADSLWSSKQSLPSNQQYDEYILPQFLNTIDDPAQRKLVVINILGSHSAYTYRIPEHRKDFRFTDDPPSTTFFKNFHGQEKVAGIINDYDASIRYTDFVVSDIFASLDKRNPGAWAAIYLSDHGEEVFDTENRFGHAGSSTSRNVYEIPFVLKISNDYAEWMRDSGILALDTTRPYQTDNLIHTLLNLAAIRTDRYDPTKSVVNPEFRVLPRWIKESPYTR